MAVGPLYELRADFLRGTQQVLWFEGEEELSAPYRFRVTLWLPLEDALALDLDGATGERATLQIRDSQTGAADCAYHGTVTALELVGDLERFSVLRLHLAPKLWQLGLGEHSRVFVDRSLPEVLAETFRDGGLLPADYELRLGQPYPSLPFVCQYRESRLAFVTRWLARAGAYYFFEQGPDQERLVVVDGGGAGGGTPGHPVRFEPIDRAGAGAPQALWTFRRRDEVLPKRVTAADTAYEKPLLAIRGSAEVMPQGPGGEVVLFGVNEELPEGAAAYAKTRALQYLARKTVYEGLGGVLGLAPGSTFELQGHPRPQLNRTYRSTQVRHRGSQVVAGANADELVGGDMDTTDVYRCEVIAVEASVQWLPPRTVPWPRIRGAVRAVVDGPAGSEYAQLDDQGRYLLRMLFDESSAADGTASCRVRMQQPHGGNPEGFHLPLRKGTEVEVAFVGGDPDRPVITGAVPNPLTPSPVTASNRTQNVLRTGGYNRLEIDDKGGVEYVDLFSPVESSFLHLGAHAGLGTHNVVLSTSGDFSLSAGGDLAIAVGAAQSETIAGDVTRVHHADQQTTVQGPRTEVVDGTWTESIRGGARQTVGGAFVQTVTGNSARRVTGDQTTTVSGDWTRTVAGSSDESFAGSRTQTVAGDVSVTTGDVHSVSASGAQTLQTSGMVDVVAHGGFNVFAPGGQTRLDQWTKNLGGTKFDDTHGWYSLYVNYRIDVRALYAELFAFQPAFLGLKWSVGGRSWHNAAIYLEINAFTAENARFSQNGGFHLW
jgi:type VI secretion system secreted protein VgrG